MTQLSLSPAPTPPASSLTPQTFYAAGPDLLILQSLPIPTTPALPRLGPSPFTNARFPILGFLEGLHDQISAHALSRLPPK